MAALWVSNNTFLESVVAGYIQDNRKIDLGVKSQVWAFFEQKVPRRWFWVTRLLFIFEMLVKAVKFRKKMLQAQQTSVRCSKDTTDAKTSRKALEESDRATALRQAFDRWSGKCAYCAGKGRVGFDILHTLGECKRGGASLWGSQFGQIVHAELYKARGGCNYCRVPKELCARWEKKDRGYFEVVKGG